MSISYTFYLIQFISVFLYSFFATMLVERYTTSHRFSKVFRILVCMINAAILPLVIFPLSANQTLLYSLVFLIILIENFVIFNATKLTILALSFGVIIHLFMCRSIIIAIHSLILEVSMANILADSTQFLYHLLAVLYLHIIVIIIFMIFIPVKAVAEIANNKMLIANITSFMGILIFFYIYNTKIFEITDYIQKLNIQQILLPITFMATFYFMLLFMVRLVSADKYQLIINELEKKVSKNQRLANAVLNFAEVIVEFDTTNDKVIRVLINSIEVPIPVGLTFSDFIQHNIVPIISEDSVVILNKICPSNIIEKYNNNQKELSYDYKSYRINLNDKNDAILVNNNLYLWFRMRIKSELHEDTQNIVSILTINEINDEKEEELALLDKTKRDLLTGAYNKEAINEKVSAWLSTGGHGTLFVFDIDNFKGLNDNLGHVFGDKVLIEIYECINSLFRSQDVIGRFGGDEFVAFIHGDTPTEEVEKIAGRVCNAIKHTYTSDNGVEVTISASIGIASAPFDATTYKELFHAADTAVYQSKHKGKNTYTVYTKNN